MPSCPGWVVQCAGAICCPNARQNLHDSMDVLQVQAMESLAKALHVEVLELRQDRARALASRGLWGHCKNLLGYMLSAYCLFR